MHKVIEVFTMFIKKVAVAMAAIISVMALSGCHQKVEPVTGIEKGMTCAELKEEISKTEKVKKKIYDNRGVCGRNALGLLFFWPSIVINEVTGESADRQATERLVELKNLYAAKKCTKASCGETAKG